MIPLVPPSTHLEMTRELTKQLAMKHPISAEDIDYIASRQYELAPDPISLAVSRLWTRLTNLFHGTSRRPA